MKTFTSIFILSTGFACITGGQGCSPGWLQFTGKCYLFSKMKDTWADAESICTAFHAKLAEPRTVEELNFLEGELSQLSHASSDQYWLGINDIAVENRWEYTSDDLAVEIQHWGPNEPNGQLGENCIAAIASYGWKWADISCAKMLPFICEKPDTDSGSVIG